MRFVRLAALLVLAVSPAFAGTSPSGLPAPALGGLGLVGLALGVGLAGARVIRRYRNK